MRIKISILFLIFLTSIVFSQMPPKFQDLINDGEYTKAQKLMNMELINNFELSPDMRKSLQFEIERLERIKKDFSRTREQVLEYIKQYIPDVTQHDFDKWERSKALEYLIIDGEKKYFQWAGPNLFRIDNDAKNIKKKIDQQKSQSVATYNRDQHVEALVKMGEASDSRYINPTNFRITYTLKVNANAVPADKVIRCWLPFPREIPQRQTDIALIASEPERYLISDNNDYLQRSVYLEKKAIQDQPTTFQIVFAYTGHAVYQDIDPAQVQPANITADLVNFIQERPPHIVFMSELKTLSNEIVGKEKNPYRIAQKIFQWIDDNIPWASAREYSTFSNIPDYVYQNRHADCGMQTIFFMTLCRMNGIPTRWQSGWSTEPDDDSMHDWGEIYFEPYGWLPVDVTYGLIDSENEKVKWFFLGNMDSYRLIVNDDYSQNFYPAKIHVRSETIDFQRGEVEWEGGNLYFDQWDYDFKVEIINGVNK